MATASNGGPTEHQVQRAFIQMILWAEKVDPRLELSFAVPNGGGRSAIQASLLKAEGQRNGVPDWVLPVPCGQHCGLMIEFKKPAFNGSGKGYLSKEQKDYIALITQHYWRVEVCYDAEDAFEIVKDYLKLPANIIDKQLVAMEAHRARTA